MPIDLKELNIKLASSDSKVENIAGMMIRALRRMPVEFLPFFIGDKDKFNYLLKQEDGEAIRRRNLRNQ